MEAEQTSSEPASSGVRQARCPRCGYDLSGTTRAWTTACEVAGTCSECGLGFEWADVLREDRAVLPGFVEHPSPAAAVLVRGFVARAVITWVWALWPPRFFARVRMHHRVSVWRMLLWLPVLCAAMYLGAGLCTMAGGLIYHGSGNLGRVVERAALDAANELGANVVSVSPRWQVHVGLGRQGLPIYLLPAAAAWALVPVLLMAIPVTRGSARVRGVFVLRAAVYSLAWVVPLFALRLLNRAGMVALVAMDRWVLGTPRPMYVRTHWFAAVLPSWTDIAFGGMVGLWLGLWWWSAVSVGMRFKTPGRVWLLLVFGPALVAFLVLLLDWRMVRFLG